MRPTSHVHDLRPAYTFVGLIAVGLQNALPLLQKSFRTFTSPMQAKIEYCLTAWLTVLPQICLVIAAASIVHLHRHRRLVSLKIPRTQQSLVHRLYHRNQHLAYAHYPAVQGRPSNLQPRFALQDHGLPVQRQVVAILGNHRVDHYVITRQTLFHDPWRQRRHRHCAVLTTAADALFALDHLHEVARRFHIQLLAFVVTDDRGFLPAGTAGLLLAADYFFHSRQTLGQSLATGVRLTLSRWLA